VNKRPGAGFPHSNLSVGGVVSTAQRQSCSPGPKYHPAGAAAAVRGCWSATIPRAHLSRGCKPSGSINVYTDSGGAAARGDWGDKCELRRGPGTYDSCVERHGCAVDMGRCTGQAFAIFAKSERMSRCVLVQCVLFVKRACSVCACAVYVCLCSVCMSSLCLLMCEAENGQVGTGPQLPLTLSTDKARTQMCTSITHHVATGFKLFALIQATMQCS